MKTPAVPPRRVAAFALLACCLSAGCWMVSPAMQAVAQQRGPEQRIVQGKVQDGSGALVSGAVVYLKDDHSLSVKSYITNSDGTYRFGQLAQSTDYELWAENSGQKSATKTISSFDSKNKFFIDLKIK